MRRVWLDVRDVLAFHAGQIREFGGQPGVRDPGLLESALARPRNRAVYAKKSSLFELAAAYAYGIARNHPFMDGNKRTALVSSFAFLELNGWEVQVSEAEAVVTFLSLADGKLAEEALADWIQRNSVKRRS